MRLLPSGRRPRNGHGRRGGLASGALLLALLASLTGQSGTALAAPSEPVAGAGANAAPAAKAGPQAAPTADPKADPKAQYEAGVLALRQSAVAAACPADLTPKTVVNCRVEAGRTVSFPLVLPQQKDMVRYRAVATGPSVGTELLAPDGAKVNCEGVPATGVTAVVMNVTAVSPTEAGHVMVYPNGRPQPSVSNINFSAGQIVPNLVTVAVVNGKVDLRNHAGSVDLIADVTGYYTATGSTFSAASPVRLLDTRTAIGGHPGPAGGGETVDLLVTGVEGVPATGVTAVVLNVTVTAPASDSFLIVYPHGVARPNVSNLNYRGGQTVSNLVIVPVIDGRVSFYSPYGPVDVIADLNGYFTG
ncbi:hypothetical protein ACIQZO_12795 [Streptomyces sp. NPDC097617]|uniref:hypothetical protein n=1 Tax=Streptomyces sp. NPDC097617 TaxID=3366091 RepID=UPI00380BF124